jgi:hypothetical protein
LKRFYVILFEICQKDLFPDVNMIFNFTYKSFFGFYFNYIPNIFIKKSVRNKVNRAKLVSKKGRERKGRLQQRKFIIRSKELLH